MENTRTIGCLQPSPLCIKRNQHATHRETNCHIHTGDKNIQGWAPYLPRSDRRAPLMEGSHIAGMLPNPHYCELALDTTTRKSHTHIRGNDGRIHPLSWKEVSKWWKTRNSTHLWQITPSHSVPTHLNQSHFHIAANSMPDWTSTRAKPSSHQSSSPRSGVHQLLPHWKRTTTISEPILIE